MIINIINDDHLVLDHPSKNGIILILNAIEYHNVLSLSHFLHFSVVSPGYY